jgi:hypothetical protein
MAVAYEDRINVKVCYGAGSAGRVRSGFLVIMQVWTLQEEALNAYHRRSNQNTRRNLFDLQFQRSAVVLYRRGKDLQ